MKKLLLFLLLLPLTTAFFSCSDDEETTWEKYREWREANDEWLIEQSAREEIPGKAYYTRIVPDWNSGAFVLIRFLSDRELTKNNLSPLASSTVDVKYHGRTYDNEPFDSSYLRTEPADSIFRTKLANVVEGWRIALQYMHVGDSVEVIVPYNVGYGQYAAGTIKPYSHLIFGIKLVDIYSLEK
ncbi:MAG: FKBP-type peptidyl-prolyl cis-trans isomerase [Muribaculaceae bacterium]